MLVTDLDCDVVYKVHNLFATSCFVYFFADSFHLIKTARNCLYNSSSGSRSHLMWNNGSYLLFTHIADLFTATKSLSCTFYQSCHLTTLCSLLTVK